MDKFKNFALYLNLFYILDLCLTIEKELNDEFCNINCIEASFSFRYCVLAFKMYNI